MKYYYDFDMEKTFTTEELKKEYEKHKKYYEYGDFDGFLEVEGAYMDEISEEIYNALQKKERYTTYLFNALTVIQERELFDDKMLREYALTELAITEKDFDDVMGREYGKE